MRINVISILSIKVSIMVSIKVSIKVRQNILKLKWMNHISALGDFFAEISPHTPKKISHARIQDSRSR